MARIATGGVVAAITVATQRPRTVQARELMAEALRRQPAQQAEALRAARAHRRKVEADQRREEARVANRTPGDFSSRGLTGFLWAEQMVGGGDPILFARNAGCA